MIISHERFASYHVIELFLKWRAGL